MPSVRFFPAFFWVLLTSGDSSPVVAAPPVVAGHQPRASQEERQATEFFERHVRPILVARCQSCHGSAKQKGGLRLDSAAAFLAGGDNGPIFEAEHPDESLMLGAIRYDGPTKMPPQEKLPDQEVAVLTSWIKSGAAWPKEIPASSKPSAHETAKKPHWSLQPVERQEPPAVKNRGWGISPIDRWVLAKLESQQLVPAPQADRRTLIRRVTFDLHGLPPTPEEVRAFESDSSPQAFSDLVDRLLASPRYGERWGRYWLDVARYSDTKGYVRLKDNPVYPTAWTYRDYVIRAFNEDLPYNRFLLEQLAADQLPHDDDPRSLAAMGFLTLGQRFLNSQPDIIDDRIDVVMRGLQGLTVTCARCHDHKYDPIPTRDYYSLYGVFANSVEPRTAPLILRPDESAPYAAYLKELHTRGEKFDTFLKTEHARISKQARDQAGEYLRAGQNETLQPNFNPVMFLVDLKKDLNPVLIQRWVRFLDQTRKQHHPVMAPWHAFAQIKPGAFAAQAGGLITHWTDDSGDPKRINSMLLQRLRQKPPTSLVDLAHTYGELFREADGHSGQDPAWGEIRKILDDPEGPVRIPYEELEDYFFVDASQQNVYHEQQRLVEDWIGTAGAAPHALILTDLPALRPAHVFIRGNSSNPGELVPRQFPALLCRGERKPFAQGSGRLELAQAIASPDNPLTARVLVNRVWQQHFGQGLVRTPGDFGVRGEPPTHPELLDFLASEFMAQGWSIKKLHRLILLSATYQQQSGGNMQDHEKDPENRLLSHANRRRLDWEALRDSLLFVAGNLDEKRGGPSVDLFRPPYSKRRSVYGFVDRQKFPGTLRAFDFAPPDATAAARYQTTVPQQALFFMNSPFLREQTQALAKLAQDQGRSELGPQVAFLYQRLYNRAPDEGELTLARTFLQREKSPPADQDKKENTPLTVWEEYVQALLMSNEFLFVD
ncbi:MAG: PSD1 and planctomycete cytochrome C domain-containing protein [Planctomycetales bacterium]